MKTTESPVITVRPHEMIILFHRCGLRFREHHTVDKEALRTGFGVRLK